MLICALRRSGGQPAGGVAGGEGEHGGQDRGQEGEGAEAQAGAHEMLLSRTTMFEMI